jgi:transcriptional regulator with XRE-family HTH domain
VSGTFPAPRDPSPDLAAYASAEIRAHLARRSITREELADVMDVHRDWLNRRLKGSVGVTLEDLQKIADALGVPVTDLLP